MNKSEIFIWLAGLPDSAPEIVAVDAIRLGIAAPAAAAPTSTRLLSMGEASAALGVSRQTTWRLVKEKKLPTVEIRRGRLRIPEAGLREFVEGRRHA